MSVGVVVGTFGDSETWGWIAGRALASVLDQTVPADVLTWSHADTLQEARNKGASQCDTDWLIFLDADDELDSGYIEAMIKASGDIRKPATLGIENGVEDYYPIMIPATDIYVTNHIVIGAMVRKELFTKVGGFSDDPVLEDWDLWLRCIQAGATIGEVPKAIYRVHVNRASRNHDVGLHGQTYAAIQRRYRR